MLQTMEDIRADKLKNCSTRLNELSDLVLNFCGYHDNDNKAMKSYRDQLSQIHHQIAKDIKLCCGEAFECDMGDLCGC